MNIVQFSARKPEVHWTSDDVNRDSGWVGSMDLPEDAKTIKPIRDLSLKIIFRYLKLSYRNYRINN